MILDWNRPTWSYLVFTIIGCIALVVYMLKKRDMEMATRLFREAVGGTALTVMILWTVTAHWPDALTSESYARLFAAYVIEFAVMIVLALNLVMLNREVPTVGGTKPLPSGGGRRPPTPVFPGGRAKPKGV